MAPPASAYRIIVRPTDVTPIAAGAGWLVWSRRTPAGFVIDARDVRGTIRTLRIAPRAIPFDAVPGRDARGRLTVVYSRCRRDQQPPYYEGIFGRSTGCRLWAFDVATGHERPVSPVPATGESFYLPALARGILLYAHRRARRLTLEVRPLAGGRTRLLPVALRAPRGGVPLVLGTSTDGRRFAVSLNDDDRRSELDLYAGGTRRTLDRGHYPERCTTEPFSPSFDAADGALHWLFEADCGTSASLVHGPPRRRGHALDAYAMARGRGVEYALVGGPDTYALVSSRPRDRPLGG